MTTGDTSVPKAQNVHWTSLDFQTILKWTVEESEHTYTVLYSEKNHDNWMDVDHCSRTSETECDLTRELEASDKNYEADIRADSEHLLDEFGSDYDFPHTYAPMFNPYKESILQKWSVQSNHATDSKSTTYIRAQCEVLFDQGGKQQTIKDILKNDLKYKISYYKSGSTGKPSIFDSSSAEVSGLDAGQSYCFMVAAFIPSRPKATQQGAWSTLQCRQGDTHFTQGAYTSWVGIIFILITVIIVFITATILCCRRNHKRHKNIQTAQSSAP
uniref:Tissue factor n=1 Tax=Poecilia formosa TaxID=48698 RepID=A0A096LXL7_POEFO